MYCLLYGRLGLSALDSGIVFDGGWRYLNGQEFFVDLYTPTGFCPIVFQSFFIRIFGPHWFSLVLHAAIFNGLFVWITGDLLRRLGGREVPAAGYALLSGMVFYPPFGTAYPDQHAFFFSLLAIYLLVRATRPGASLSWLLGIGPVLVLAMLSKQVPSAYAALLFFLLAPLLIPIRSWAKAFGWLSLGGILGALLVLNWFPWAAMDLDVVYRHVWELPQQEGGLRLAELDYDPAKIFRAVLFRSFQTVSDGPIVFHHLVYQVPLIGLLLGGIFGFFRAEWKNRFEPLLLAWGLAAVSGAFVLLTFNQGENGVPYIFLCVGLVQLFWRKWRSHLELERPWLAAGAWLAQGLLLWVALSVAWPFHREVVATRMVHDFPEGEGPAFSWPSGTQDLDFLVWKEPWLNAERDPRPVIDFLRQEDEAFYLFGDLSLLYPMTGQVSPSPFLWLHPGLTLPVSDAPGFKEYDQLLRAHLKRQAPRWWVWDSPEGITYKEMRPEDFPLSQTYLKSRVDSTFQMGTYTLHRLKP